MQEKIRNFKGKRPLFFFTSYIILIPVINMYLKVLEKSFNINYRLVENHLEIFKIIFNNPMISIIGVIITSIICLIVNNIAVTIKNSKIEVEGVNLKKKDGTFGTADWDDVENIKEYLSVGVENGIVLGKTEDNQCIVLPEDTYLNKNIAVFGASRK